MAAGHGEGVKGILRPQAQGTFGSPYNVKTCEWGGWGERWTLAVRASKRAVVFKCDQFLHQLNAGQMTFKVSPRVDISRGNGKKNVQRL